MTIRILLFFGLLSFAACKDQPVDKVPNPTLPKPERKVFKEGSVYADNEFDGARLNDFKQLNDSTYQAFIYPENTPINSSPWFGFRIWSKEAINIRLVLTYPDDYKHRYIPKLSHDGIHWKASEPSDYQIDSTNWTLSLALKLSPKKLWVSAQENLHSQYLYDWVDSLAQQDFMDQEVIGKSVQGKPISLLRIKAKNPKQAIILIGRQHPPEVPGGTISLMAFVHAILADSQLAKTFREHFEVLVFPLLNPDGVDDGYWRHNANGADLNRDWIQFQQPETRVVKNKLSELSNTKTSPGYCFGIDFHTSYSGPYLLVLDTLPHKVKPIITNQWIKQIELAREEKLDIRPRAQSLPYCYNWMINELDIEAVTYEEGDEINRAIVKQRARDYANELMDILLKKYYPQEE